MTATIPQEDRCETCFGTGQIVTMRPVRFGHMIELPPECRDCNGTGNKPKPD